MKVHHGFSDSPLTVREGTSIVVVSKITGVFYLRFADADGKTTHEIPVSVINAIEP